MMGNARFCYFNVLSISTLPTQCNWSQPLPLIPGDVALLQDPEQEPLSDVASVWIGNSQPDATTDHELMVAARERAFKAELAEIRDEPVPPDRSGGRHYRTP
jgi:hypothetical protein